MGVAGKHILILLVYMLNAVMNVFCYLIAVLEQVSITLVEFIKYLLQKSNDN